MTPKASATAATLPAATSARPLAVFGEYWELTKPRLSMLSVLTAVVGYLAAKPEPHFGIIASLLAGTTSAAFGAGVLDQWLEREIDARMEGLYLRIEADGKATGRAKMVRPEFVERVKLSEHWQHQQMIPNELAAGADIWS